MQSIRRVAVAASSLAIAPSIRPHLLRAHRIRPTVATRLKAHSNNGIFSLSRSYATQDDKPESTISESAGNAASQATESLKGTAEATKQFSSDAISQASHTAGTSPDAVEDSMENTASRASQSLRGTAEATKRYAGEAASGVSNVSSKAAGAAQNTASNATAGVAQTAQDISAFGSSPAPSTQSTPIRTEGRSEGLDGPTPSSNLYIGNLYFEVTNASLREEFSRFGEVVNAKVIYDARGLSKGFGYVQLATTEQAAAAKEALDQQVFEGRRMAVQFAISQGPKTLPPSNEAGYRHPPSRTLYIGNMSYDMSDKDLNDLFREIKNVTDVRVAIDRRTGQPRGYAHADFLDVQSATKAAEYLKSKTFHGRSLRVDYTHSRTSQSPPRSSTPM